MAEAKKVPLIAAQDRATFSGAEEDAMRRGYDLTYVGGYSDVRAKAELDQRRGARPVMPQVRLQWVRTQTPGGRTDGQDIAWHRAQGYTFVPKDLEPLGLQVPDSGQWNAGTNRWELGDTALMYCSREVAARNENVLRRATDERSTADASAGALHDEGQKVGRSLGQDMLTEASVKRDAIIR